MRAMYVNDGNPLELLLIIFETAFAQLYGQKYMHRLLCILVFVPLHHP